jgi:hypothetical protein
MPSSVLPSTQRILYTLLWIVIAIFIIPHIVWFLFDDTPLDVFVVDKTVGNEYREHRSLFWIMTHWKIVKPTDRSSYNPYTDYYGFHPVDSTSDDAAHFDIMGRDLVYLADTYGVYNYPVDYEAYERLIPNINVPISLKYGGISRREISAIEQYKSSGGTLIAEFNTLQDPTMRDRDIVERLQRALGVRFNNVLGKYFEHLDDAPKWMKERYFVQDKREWTFTGSGIIITDTRSGRETTPGIVVLDRNDLSKTPMEIYTKDHPLLNGVAREVPYYHFFEYIIPESSSIVLAEFLLNCTASGIEKMKNANLPIVFPAVIASDSALRSVYFAGNFADNEIHPSLTMFYGIEIPLYYLYAVYFVSDQTRFFWRFYLPLMKNIFSQTTLHSPQRPMR